MTVQNDLSQTNEELEDSFLSSLNEQMKVLVATGHEVKSYVHNVQNIAGLLYDNAENLKEEDLKRYLKLIYSNTSAIMGFLDEILEYARSGKDDYKERFNLDLKSALEYSIQKYKDIYLVDSVIFNFTEEDDALKLVVANDSRMYLVFSNLINNAIKYSITNPVINISLKTVLIDSVEYVR